MCVHLCMCTHMQESTCACVCLPVRAYAHVPVFVLSEVCACPSLSLQLGKPGGLRHKQRKEQS